MLTQNLFQVACLLILILVQSSEAISDQKTTLNTLNAIIDTSEVPLDTSCYRDWHYWYGANKQTLEEPEFQNNTLTNFNQKVQLYTMPALLPGQEQRITFLTACGTMLQPITDLGVQVGILDMEAKKVLYTQNNVAFGTPAMPIDSTFRCIHPNQDDPKICHNFTLSFDEYVEMSEIQSFKNEITKLTFKTNKGRDFSIGHDIRNKVHHTVKMKLDDSHFVGFRGTLSSNKNSDLLYMSQLSFVIWQRECVPKNIIIIGAAYFVIILILSVIVSCMCCSRYKKKMANKRKVEMLPQSKVFDGPQKRPNFKRQIVDIETQRVFISKRGSSPDILQPCTSLKNTNQESASTMVEKQRSQSLKKSEGTYSRNKLSQNSSVEHLADSSKGNILSPQDPNEGQEIVSTQQFAQNLRAIQEMVETDDINAVAANENDVVEASFDATEQVQAAELENDRIMTSMGGGLPPIQFKKNPRQLHAQQAFEFHEPEISSSGWD